MNEFTKEELNFIWQRLAITDYSNFKEMKELPNKVCAMIDNYCEHEWGNVCCGCDIAYICCRKCEKDMSDFDNE